MKKDSLRVLHFVASSSGGGATYARDLVNGLEQDGLHNTLLMPSDRGQMAPAELKNTIEWNEGFRQLRTLVAASHIVNCHGARAAFWGRLASIGLGERRPLIVYTIHGFMVPHYPIHERLLFGSIELLLKGRVDRCIAVSEAEKYRWCQYGLAAENDVDVIPYGIQPEDASRTRAQQGVREELGIPQDAIVLTQVARFYWPRDFKTLLSAFDRASSQHASLHLLLVGDGPWREQVEQQVASMKHGNRVMLTGIRVDIDDVFEATDIAVLSSAGGDGFPIVNLEAMRAGLPVISAQCDGIPEQITPGEHGLLYPVGDKTALCEHMLDLSTHADKRTAMGTAGQQRVAKTFTRNRMLDDTRAVFLRLMESSP